MNEINLLNKTELWIVNIKIDDVNLNELADRLSKVIGIDRDKVNVVDAHEDVVTFDILEKNLDPNMFFGKKDLILQELSEVDGFFLTENSDIHSEGILGMVSLPENEVDSVINSMANMKTDILGNIAKRALIFSTGHEIKNNFVEDTNSPYIIDYLNEHGYKSKFGGILEDDIYDYLYNLNDAIDSGYGLIITTGGVGAEAKDHSVEAMLEVAQEAYTPYIVKYKVGHGRHVKDGVRIGVGVIGPTMIVNLPGPNDEVRLALPILVSMLEEKESPKDISEKIAEVLREKLRNNN